MSVYFFLTGYDQIKKRAKGKCVVQLVPQFVEWLSEKIPAALKPVGDKAISIFCRAFLRKRCGFVHFAL